MSWQNEARSRSANAVFHKHKDLVAQSAEGNSSLEGAAAPAPSSYILQQPMHMAVHMPPVPMAVHNPGQLPSQMMPVNMAPQMLPLPMYTVGQMGAMSAPGAFEGEIVQKNALPMKVDGYYNLEPILYQNIMDSDYFRSLAKLVTFHDIVEELEKTVEHCEPHLAGQNTIPSSAFCVLMKMFQLGLSRNQIVQLIKSETSFYAHALALLYLRYVIDPKDLWHWFEKELDCEDVFVPGSSGGIEKRFGSFARELLENQHYYTTMFPRIPVPVFRDLQKRLLTRDSGGVYVEEVSKEHDWPVGTRCKAKYSADNLWYHAQIVELVAGGKFVARFLPLSCFQRASGHARIRYVVEFVDYSEKQMTDKEHVRVPKSEQEFIGVFEKKAGQKQESKQRDSRGDDRRDDRRGEDYRRDDYRRDDYRDSRGSGGRGRSRSPARDQKSIEEQIREREREKALAVGKNYANKRPTSYKTALMTMTNTATTRRRSRSRSPPRDHQAPRRRSPSPQRSDQGARKGPSADAVARMEALKHKYG